jgi:hypothetical protein
MARLTSLFVAYRLSTFPLIHLNAIHVGLNLVALVPLMERFENEYGTLTSLALFFGRENSISFLCPLATRRFQLTWCSVDHGSGVTLCRD